MIENHKIEKKLSKNLKLFRYYNSYPWILGKSAPPLFVMIHSKPYTAIWRETPYYSEFIITNGLLPKKKSII